ncbi:G-protein coupled receptor daf-37 [Aplysia californica]|uniref:G-protein coupled receptor daf-37 n=1 Tax=Aplysia californica TaxID=6500 RepID=A0ABM0JMN8_APLCA|nr:G-protein coupled receptor daf-37 [Aplysia californica]
MASNAVETTAAAMGNVDLTYASSSAIDTLTSTIATVLSSSLAGVDEISKNMNKEMEAPMKIDQYLHYLMSAIVGPIVCILGLIGNVLSLITWCRPGMRSSTGRYLTGQAVADFGVLLFFLLCDSVQFWAPSVGNSEVYGVFFCYIGYPFFFLTIICSIWFTVGVTVDRYIMVCWLTKAKRLCNERHANFGLLLITVNCFLINIPHFASFSPVLDRAENDTGKTFVHTDFEKGSGGQFYEFWIHCIILILIPWVSVLAMNIMIIKKLNKTNKKMADKKTNASVMKSKQSENQITRLLLTVTFTFLFFIGLQCIIQCFAMRQPSWADMTKVSSAFAFAKTGVVFNSSTNFLLYCLTGRRFRKELAKMLGCSKRGSSQLSSLIDHPSSGPTSGASTTSTTGI